MLERLRQKNQELDTNWDSIGKICQIIKIQQIRKYLFHIHTLVKTQKFYSYKIEYVHSYKILQYTSVH